MPFHLSVELMRCYSKHTGRRSGRSQRTLIPQDNICMDLNVRDVDENAGNDYLTLLVLSGLSHRDVATPHTDMS